MGNEFSKLITLKNKRNRPSSLNEGNDEALDGEVVADEEEMAPIQEVSDQQVLSQSEEH